ncbi:hypothetical protein [Borrelia persica]|uniref:hypothetical protein n=1 Tax=Borrelia persica TaxID=44448 RepID=UPI0004653C5F|nr:hypothetical protein [Borrelia persica]
MKKNGKLGTNQKKTRKKKKKNEKMILKQIAKSKNQEIIKKILEKNGVKKTKKFSDKKAHKKTQFIVFFLRFNGQKLGRVYETTNLQKNTLKIEN